MSVDIYHDRRRVARSFKMRGFAVQASALNAMMNVLSRESKDRGEEILEAILDEIREKMMSMPSSSSSSSRGGFIVTKKVLASVVADMSRNSKDVTDEALQLLDAYETPRIAFDSMRKQFSLIRDRMEARSFFGDAVHKPDMFAQRYALVQQRILRQDLFRPKLVTADGRHANGDGKNLTHAITPVESLLGRTGVKFLLGMIVQVEEGQYYLEDQTAQVPMDLSETSVLTDGFIAENCIVLVEGEMIDGVLHVHRLGNPIVESRTDSIDAIGLQNSDLFNSMSTISEYEKLREQELEHGPEGMFSICSNVHLDKPDVLDKLDKLFSGFDDLEQSLPVFVLMGDFCSVPASTLRDGNKIIMGYYEELANMIAKYPRIANDARFIFIPGPNDPGMADILPRQPIPEYFTGALRSKVQHAIFATNPCRIRYFTKEIVFFRQNLIHKLQRNCILRPRTKSTALSSSRRDNASVQHAVKTILDQGHLTPLPLSSCPIYWQHDHALRLYPLPDALVLGDSVDQFYENYADCDAINPGSFSNDFNFVVYQPVGDDGDKSMVEFSQIS